jgi:hypothetical protein
MVADQASVKPSNGGSVVDEGKDEIGSWRSRRVF